ncbi:MAG: hypothetical protein KAJ20_01680, partial [Candidatus Aenigmarchaeota archaeon]|nr:hypothetical protein [Candidatus Aenigmarchaeota archaeon]
KINVAGDNSVGWIMGESQQDIRDFLWQFHPFDKIHLDLRGISVESGTYNGQFGKVEQTLSNIGNWIPDYMMFEDLYINVTGSRVKSDDGLTVFENGKAREPEPEECWPVSEAGTLYLSPL